MGNSSDFLNMALIKVTVTLPNPVGTSPLSSSSGLGSLTAFSLCPPCEHVTRLLTLLWLLFCPRSGTPYNFNVSVLFPVYGLSPLPLLLEHKLPRPRFFVCFVLGCKLSVWHVASHKEKCLSKNKSPSTSLASFVILPVSTPCSRFPPS